VHFFRQTPARLLAPPPTDLNRLPYHCRNQQETRNTAAGGSRVRLAWPARYRRCLDPHAQSRRNRTPCQPRIHGRYGSTMTSASYDARFERFQWFSSPFMCIRAEKSQRAGSIAVKESIRSTWSRQTQIPPPARCLRHAGYEQISLREVRLASFGSGASRRRADFSLRYCGPLCTTHAIWGGVGPPGRISASIKPP